LPGPEGADQGGDVTRTGGVNKTGQERGGGQRRNVRRIAEMRAGGAMRGKKDPEPIYSNASG